MKTIMIIQRRVFVELNKKIEGGKILWLKEKYYVGQEKMKFESLLVHILLLFSMVFLKFFITETWFHLLKNNVVFGYAYKNNKNLKWIWKIYQ